MELLDQFLQGHRMLTGAIEGLTPEQMKKAVFAGKWTIHENVIHVVDADLVYAERIKRILAEEKPKFLPFDQDLWTKRLDYHKRDVQTYLELFRLIRESVADLLQGMPDGIWEKKGFNGQQEVSVRQLVEALIAHVANHVQAIERIRKEIG